MWCTLDIRATLLVTSAGVSLSCTLTDRTCFPYRVEPVVLEFPELIGRSRRDYWLAIIREIVFVHQFIRGNQLETVGRQESLAKAVLGIARLRATKEVLHAVPARPERLLTFSFADVMPGGDLVLKALADRLHAAEIGTNDYMGNLFTTQEGYRIASPSAVDAVDSLAVTSPKRFQKEAPVCVGEVLIGELTPLERAVLQSRENHRKVQLANASIDGLRVDAKGIGTNVAVLQVSYAKASLVTVCTCKGCVKSFLHHFFPILCEQELLVPVMSLVTWFQELLTWNEPSKTVVFCSLVTYIVYRFVLYQNYDVPSAAVQFQDLLVFLRHSAQQGLVGLLRIHASAGTCWLYLCASTQKRSSTFGGRRDNTPRAKWCTTAFCASTGPGQS